MKVVCWLLTGFIGLSLTTAAGAWEQGDRSNYNNKMALLGVLLEGAKERAQVVVRLRHFAYPSALAKTSQRVV